MWKLLDRYVFFELLTPFVLTLSALMMILLIEQMVQLTDLFINKGVSFSTVGKIFVYLLPTFLVIAIPMGVLIATIISFSRLMADHEITALMASGVSLSRLAFPVQVFTVLTFALTFSLSAWAQPWVGHSMKSAAMDLLKQEFSLGLEPGIFNEPLDNMMIYVDDMPEPTRLKGIMIYDLRDSAQPVLILAQEGTILSDPTSDMVGLRLLNGSQHRESGDPSRHQWITFKKYEFKLDLAAIAKRSSEDTDTSTRIQQIKAKMTAAQTLDRSELRTLEEYYKTYSFPFSCLIFGMIGIPLGLVIKQGGRLGGFALGIAMALLYYLFMMVSDFLVTSLLLPPLIAAWAPNILMTLLAIFFIAGPSRGLFIQSLRPGGR
ncbi:MAG TPA: LptF/LptG family permease [Nitrospiria bacterium]|nr:LptF/LptG family permease [Nitrospiria bacterium]HUK56481.1 LptF/LptG family permease [Nitrospiria bacterium]